MKKGFTLVELMMVMVIVGILVVIALPKYNEALERSRALEGINVLKAVSDAINAQYVLDGNQYKSQNLSRIDRPRSKYFSTPSYTGDGHNQIMVTREEWGYTLTAQNSNGVLDRIICMDNNAGDDCRTIGITSGYGSYYGYGMFVMDMGN